MTAHNKNTRPQVKEKASDIPTLKLHCIIGRSEDYVVLVEGGNL